MRAVVLVAVVVMVGCVPVSRVTKWSQDSDEFEIAALLNYGSVKARPVDIDSTERQAADICGERKPVIVSEGIRDAGPVTVGGGAYGFSSVQTVAQSEYVWVFRCAK